MAMTPAERKRRSRANGKTKERLGQVALAIAACVDPAAYHKICTKLGLDPMTAGAITAAGEVEAERLINAHRAAAGKEPLETQTDIEDFLTSPNGRNPLESKWVRMK